MAYNNILGFTMTIQVAPKSYHPIHRQNGSSSRQPRFQNIDPKQFFTSLFRFYKTDIQDEPEYGERARDAWLRKIWKLEPYLAGVINSVVNIDKNRGWSLIGGRNQVRRFSNILHNHFYFAPDLSGWRSSFGGSALSYYTSDMGSITEVARTTQQGPMEALFFVDPAQCYLTGSFDTPLVYNPTRQSKQFWNRDDYFRVVSMPSTNENLYGLGFCALSRCLELAKIMVGIYQYDNEMLLNRAPRGLLLLKGITQDQWEDAMTARQARLDGDEKRYYGAVNVLATLDPGVEIEAQLTALSSLPAEFDQETFTNLLMYGYALAFGYDPREFWPVSAGSLGTATETEAQHRKGGAKGGLDFTLGFAEKLQSELPDTLQFTFEERDLDGELANSEADRAKAKVVTMLYESGLSSGLPLIDRQEARILLAEQQLIDPEWTENQEESIATDTENIGRETIQRAMYAFPDEPIIKYMWRSDGHPIVRVVSKPRILPRSFIVIRQGDIDTELNDYLSRLENISEQANNGDIPQSEYETRLNNSTIAILTLSILRGTGDDSASSETLQNAAIRLLNDPFDTSALEIVTDNGLLSDVIPPSGIDRLSNDIDVSLQSTLANTIYGGFLPEIEDRNKRLSMWRNTARGLHTYGKLLGNPDVEYTWRLGQTEEHCVDCLRLNGQTMTGAEWVENELVPQDRNLSCNGYNCDCRLEEG